MCSALYNIDLHKLDINEKEIALNHSRNRHAIINIVHVFCGTISLYTITLSKW